MQIGYLFLGTQYKYSASEALRVRPEKGMELNFIIDLIQLRRFDCDTISSDIVSFGLSYYFNANIAIKAFFEQKSIITSNVTESNKQLFLRLQIIV